MFRIWMKYSRIQPPSRKICLIYLILASLFIAQVPLLSANDLLYVDGIDDDYRFIPDILTGGNYHVEGYDILDIVILGDGYLSGEKNRFFNDALLWYDLVIDPATGIRPFTLFAPAFRVRAIFKASDYRAGGPDDEDRRSYYKVKLNSDGHITGAGGWFSGEEPEDPINLTFRERLYDAIYELNPYLSPYQYPAELDTNPWYTMANKYSNIVIVMMVLNDGAAQASGFAADVKSPYGNQIVRIAFGECWEHEFGHSFAYLSDEYIKNRGQAYTDSNNIPPGERSIYNLMNLTFSNERCDLLWPHLAPGGQYNPDEFSLLGNLFRGGLGKERQVWHSEYQCLMNGTHNNYLCETDPACPNNINLRDHEHLCFWCEEITAIRILARTGYFREKLGEDPDVNQRGRLWYTSWLNSLRGAYYTHFNIPEKIAEKNACYTRFLGWSCPDDFPNCQTACDSFLASQVPCLWGCAIREVGNAVYVYSGAGSFQNGSWGYPYDDVSTAIAESYARCSDPHMIIIKPGYYPDTMTLTIPALLTADGCGSVILGE